MFKQLFNFRPEANTDHLQVGSRLVPLLLVRHPRARRYLLRLSPDGVAKVTVPRRGNIKEARDFAVQNTGWLEQQFQRLAAQPTTPVNWGPGTEILFRGELVCIEAGGGKIRFGNELIKAPLTNADFRPAIQKYLHKLAQQELPKRVQELARIHGVDVCRISVRDQRARWGSCSRKGTVSLNWRLIQTPAFVRDYIILHELTHRKHMNHSDKFWREVERLCPDYLEAERWVKQHGKLLR